jgi:hypothetical protein
MLSPQQPLTTRSELLFLVWFHNCVFSYLGNYFCCLLQNKTFKIISEPNRIMKWNRFERVPECEILIYRQVLNMPFLEWFQYFKIVIDFIWGEHQVVKPLPKDPSKTTNLNLITFIVYLIYYEHNIYNVATSKICRYLTEMCMT